MEVIIMAQTMLRFMVIQPNLDAETREKHVETLTAVIGQHIDLFAGFLVMNLGYIVDDRDNLYVTLRESLLDLGMGLIDVDYYPEEIATVMMADQ